MASTSYAPVFELTRGNTVESIHYGAVAVVDALGNLVAAYGNPYQVTFMRSSAKPFQLLPLIESGGQAYYRLTPREIALMCASHSGTDEHTALVQTIQGKVGVAEAELLCGVHYPFHEPTMEAMKERKEKPTPNRHNCSGKHTGMLAYSRLRDPALEAEDDSLPYIDPSHPVQKEILAAFADMAQISTAEIGLGIDGCSAPNFAIPLYNAALAFARLCDPPAGGVEPEERAAACRAITSAMMFNPDMVAGPGRLDTRLMEVGRGMMVAKGGAEGFQAIGLLPGVMGANSPGVGIAFKISDGDQRGKAREAVALEILRQLGILNSAQLGLLSEFGPTLSVQNWRKIEVGHGKPVFQLDRP